MDHEDDELYRPSTSRSERSDLVAPEQPIRPPSLLNGHNLTDSDMNSDIEDNDSDDDHCIYTYRGDQQEPTDDYLPVRNTCKSPLMDYLEMDFEPGFTVGNESEDEDIVPNATVDHNELLNNTEEPIPSTSAINDNEQNDQTNTNSPKINDTNGSISQSPVSNSDSSFTNFNEERSGCIRRNSDTTEVCQKMKRMRVDDLSWVKEMVWSESDASQFQVSQIGVSACGATAVINTLLALRIPFNIDRIIQTIGTRLRDETASLIPYLESRSVAGCMPQDLVRTLETATDSLVSARFFATRENLDLPIAPWIASWIKKGAVPILTLNLQRAVVPHSLIPDSWHHQMMYGIAHNPLHPECAQIYLTNPLGQSSMEALQPQLMSPSKLLIRRNDIISRWNPNIDLSPLINHPLKSWNELNVLGQVVNIIREEKDNFQLTNHITIPASYKSGITLAMRTSSNYSHELKSVPEL